MVRSGASLGRTDGVRPEVALVAAEPSLRLGLMEAVGTPLVPIGAAGTLEDGRRLLAMHPLLLVLSLSPPLPGSSTEMTCRALIQEHPATRVLVLVAQGDAEAARVASKCGAVGIYHTSADAATLRDALLRLARGDSAVQPVLRRALSRAEAGSAPLRSPVGDLAVSDAELRTLRLLAGGATTSEVATILGSSVRAVDCTVARAVNRLRASHRSEAVAIIARKGLL